MTFKASALKVFFLIEPQRYVFYIDHSKHDDELKFSVYLFYVNHFL